MPLNDVQKATHYVDDKSDHKLLNDGGVWFSWSGKKWVGVSNFHYFEYIKSKIKEIKE